MAVTRFAGEKLSHIQEMLRELELLNGRMQNNESRWLLGQGFNSGSRKIESGRMTMPDGAVWPMQKTIRAEGGQWGEKIMTIPYLFDRLGKNPEAFRQKSINERFEAFKKPTDADFEEIHDSILRKLDESGLSDAAVAFVPYSKELASYPFNLLTKAVPDEAVHSMWDLGLLLRRKHQAPSRTSRHESNWDKNVEKLREAGLHGNRTLSEDFLTLDHHTLNPELKPGQSVNDIVLLDDSVSSGISMLASALKLKEKFPAANIHPLAVWNYMGKGARLPYELSFEDDVADIISTDFRETRRALG